MYRVSLSFASAKTWERDLVQNMPSVIGRAYRAEAVLFKGEPNRIESLAQWKNVQNVQIVFSSASSFACSINIYKQLENFVLF